MIKVFSSYLINKMASGLMVVIVALCALGASNMDLKLSTFTPDTIADEFKAAYNVEERRLGELVLGDTGIKLATVEKPFLANPRAPGMIDPGIPYESAVPAGEYDVVLRYSPTREGKYWHFHNEDLGVFLEKSDTTEDWHRFSTMFHIGNYVSSVVGCVAVGRRIHDFGGDHGLGVASSAVAMNQLHEALASADHHKLVIS